MGWLRSRSRQGQLQLAAHGHRVVVEQLVEVAHAEEEQGVGILSLGRRPLAHERREVGVSPRPGFDRLLPGGRFVRWGRLWSHGLEVFSDHAFLQLNVVGRVR